ncbi:hypothetical protein FRC04_001000 [Tulasnella sp. 424]|nr:hypothetical protein FRC04_001000 [Tulasnella sp. 424]KAG8977908.1 hypothetical protein FRC05_000436 [Tulasnella sp. 425]
MESPTQTVITQDGVVLDQAVVDEKLESFAPFFIPESRLLFGRAKSLGQGGFGLVKKATLLPAEGPPAALTTVAVKILKADDWNVPPVRVAYRVAREMLVWSACSHDHILKFIGHSLTEDRTIAYLVSPFMKNGNIQHYLSKRKINLPQRLEFVRDTLRGLEYLHSLTPPIVHGDLKSLNVLVNDNLRAVLCDFGLSATMEGRKAELNTAINFKGSPRWCSPEALLETGKTLKSDIWSWGCLALEIMTGKPPYNDIKNEMNLLLGLLWRCWEYNPERRPDVSTCMSIDRSIQIQAKGAPEWDTRWMDEWIMKFIPEFEIAAGECIYIAARDPNMARNLCCVASLSTAELELDFREAAYLLDLDRGGKRLSRAATDYFFLRKAVIKSELLRRAQPVTRVASKRRQDPVSQILHIFTLLRGRATLTRVRLGECLRELHSLLKTVIVPLDPKNDQLASNLSAFEPLVRHYPDDSHDPETTNFLMDVYYGHHNRLGNYRLGFDVALQAAQRYRHLSEGDRNQTQNLLPRLANALDKAVDCAEFIHEDETARPLLQEAIKVHRKLVYVNPQGKQVQIPETKVLLARTLVRYHRVVYRLEKELAVHWKKDAMDALREAIEIYDTARSFGQSGRAKYGEELKAALMDLLAMARRRENKQEVAEAEARLRRLHDEEQD